jgi:hypothetical protein
MLRRNPSNKGFGFGRRDFDNWDFSKLDRSTDCRRLLVLEESSEAHSFGPAFFDRNGRKLHRERRRIVVRQGRQVRGKHHLLWLKSRTQLGLCFRCIFVYIEAC